MVVVVFLTISVLTVLLVFNYRQLQRQTSTEKVGERTMLEDAEREQSLDNIPYELGGEKPLTFTDLSISEFRAKTSTQIMEGNTEVVFDEGEITKVIEAKKKYEVFLGSGEYTVLIGTDAYILEIVSETNKKGEVVGRVYNPISPDQMEKDFVVGTKVLVRYIKKDLQESGGQKIITVEEFDVIR